MKTSRQKTGALGEHLALQHLQQNGYIIVDRNWHGKSGEVDLIAKQGDMLVFVEVRTRHVESTEVIFDSVTQRKQANMESVVYEYLAENELDQETLWRVDMIAIALRRNASPMLDHVEDVLAW